MLDPDPFIANLQRGSLLLDHGRPQEALPFLLDAIAANPDHPEPYAELARCFNAIPAERHKSIAAIDQAIAFSPNTARYFGLKGWYLNCQWYYRAALKVGQQGLALDPTCPFSLNTVANAHTKLGQWKKAEAVCRTILELDPDDTAALNLLAQALRYQGRWKESNETVARVLANLPDDAFGHTTAGEGALAAGDHLRANDHFLQALRKDPHSELARKGLLTSLRARNWLIRFNTRMFNSTHRPMTCLNLALLLLAFISVFGFLYLCYLLNGYYPQAGTYLFGAAIASVFLYLYLSLLVAFMGDFLLLFDPLGRHALTGREKLHAIFPVIVFITAIVITVAKGGALIALALVLVFAVLGFSIQYPLLKDRWQRRRESESAE